ncbi:unnamed protein product [Larinioides sclopetarius]|uniref:Uncharacterized protein n=1 Tax=Larinioides sclopetarius TaxID=280406 RepID=A0AAV2ARL5_9ARAC
MTMGRYLCQLCYTIINYGDKNPCFFYKNDDVVYTIPQQQDTEEMCTNRDHAKNLNDCYGNTCEVVEETRSTSQALTSVAHFVSPIENKELDEVSFEFSRDFIDRPSSPEALFNAPNRKGEMDAQVKQPLEFKKDAGTVAGPSAFHPAHTRTWRRKTICLR